MHAVAALQRERLLRSLTVAGILGAGIIAILMVEHLLVSSVLAFVISYLLAPLVNAMERSGLGRKAAVTALFLLLAGLLAVIVFLVLPTISRQLSHLQNQWPRFVEAVTRFLTHTEATLKALALNGNGIDISQSASRTLSTVSGRLFKELPQVISSSLSVVILAPFLAYFMLLDGQRAARSLMALVPNPLFEMALTLKHQINLQLGDFIRARLLEAAIVGGLVWGGLGLIGFPYAGILAVFAGLTNLIPYIGPFIGALPAVLIAGVDGASGWLFLTVVAVYLSAQLVDNLLIIPLLVAKIVDLHPVAVVLVIVAGAQIGGLLGMIISIPVACIIKLTIYTVYRHALEFRSR
jgi:putative permease